ncbi:hypothetical protein CANARDRAFT_182405, partial [[Candida] arabinofermentans NRRL YB-2248]
MGNTQSTAAAKPPKITEQDKAILQLKLQRDKLHKSTIKIESIINREKEIAKKCIINNDKRKAMLALKKKKYQLNLLETIEKQSNILEELINTIEFKLIEKDVLYGLEQGNHVLKQLNNEMSIDKVEKIMDDSEEGIRYQEELSERLGELMPKSLEDEVDLEFEEMEREELQRQKNVIDQVPIVLPDAPTTSIKEDDDKVEQE